VTLTESNGVLVIADAFPDVAPAETPRLLQIAFAILRDPQGAEDAVQDTLLMAWKSWSQLRDPARRRAWLTRICVRRCLRLRSSLALRRRVEATAASLDGAPAQDDGDLDWDAAFLSLSPAQRAVVTLHYHHDLTLDDCAGVMGCRPGTARRHLARALEKLRKEVRS
jgi:RNA polymerase sigma-70 factor (ECF subfamily)